MCKIEFHDKEFWKINKRNGIEFFKFSIEQVWKRIFKNVWEPCVMCGTKHNMVYDCGPRI